MTTFCSRLAAVEGGQFHDDQCAGRRRGGGFQTQDPQRHRLEAMPPEQYRIGQTPGSRLSSRRAIEIECNAVARFVRSGTVWGFAVNW